TFAVLAGSTVTSTGATTVNGDLGLSPGTAVTGFPPGTVNGTIHAGDPAAAQAQLDLTTAYNDAAGRTVGAIGVAGNLGGQTLTPGLYKSTSSLEISSGDGGRVSRPGARVWPPIQIACPPAPDLQGLERGRGARRARVWVGPPG